jgi:hypothetical protein
MATKKKQHYVARSYLGLFGHANGKQVDLYNIKGRSFVGRASIRHQCVRSYFYSREQHIENFLGDVDQDFAVVFRTIQERGTIDYDPCDERVILTLFAVLQWMRTQAQRDQSQTFDVRMTESCARKLPELTHIDFDEFKIQPMYKGWARRNVLFALESLPIILDLRPRLLINRSETDFITSDNPVIMQSVFLHDRHAPNNPSLAIKGLQILYPIGPRHYIMLYDPTCYRVGSDKKAAVEVRSKCDISRLNKLQFLSALQNIFLPPSLGEAYAKKLADEFGREHTEPGVVYREYPQVTSDNSELHRFKLAATKPSEMRGESMVIMMQPKKRYRAEKFSFVQEREETRGWKPTRHIAQVRNMVADKAFRNARDTYVPALRDGTLRVWDYWQRCADEIASAVAYSRSSPTRERHRLIV